MNSKISKRLRKFAQERGIPERSVKRVYNSLTKQQKAKINKDLLETDQNEEK